MTNPTPLSSAAAAVLDTYNDATSRVEPDLAVIAAALRAAADQVVPKVVNTVGDEHDEARRDQWLRIRYKFLAIAAELKGATHDEPS